MLWVVQLTVAVEEVTCPCGDVGDASFGGEGGGNLGMEEVPYIPG